MNITIDFLFYYAKTVAVLVSVESVISIDKKVIRMIVTELQQP